MPWAQEVGGSNPLAPTFTLRIRIIDMTILLSTENFLSCGRIS